MPKLLTTSEAAAILGITDSRVRQLVRAGRLESQPVEERRGTVHLIPAAAVKSFRRRKAGRPKALPDAE